MMEATLPRSWMEEFERAAAVKREDVVYREKTIRFETKERERREERAEDRREREEAAGLDLMLASTEQIATFKGDLDRYDTVTVEALIENQQALEAVRGRIDTMLDEATVLPDGRKAFKTRDGLRVFDQNGQELSRDLIEPESIDDRKPKWESLTEAQDQYVSLTEERQALSDYQAKLDDARERLDRGEITNKELKELKADLRADIPDAVRMKLERDDPKAAADFKPQGAAPLPDDMDALMRQTGLVSPAPGLSR